MLMQVDMRGNEKSGNSAVAFIAALFLTINMRTSTMSTTRIAK